MPDRLPNRPSSVLAAFVEALVEGRRVVVFGDASSRLSEHVLDRGARLVHVCDADPARLAAAVTRNTAQHISYSPLTAGGLAFREGAFDLGLVEDLSASGSPSPTEVLRLLKRAVCPRGTVLIASRNPHVEDALLPSTQAFGRRIDYYDLYDLVSAEFDTLRMYGQMPFVGYAIAEFGKHEEPEPVVDTTLVPGGTEEPEWFVAVAGEPCLRLDPFTLVELPVRDMMPATLRRAQAKITALQDSERTAQRRVAELDAELSVAKEKLSAQPVAAAHSLDMERALKERDAWIEQLEARSTTADARADAVQSELEATQSRLAQVEHACAAALQEAEKLRSELAAERASRESLKQQMQAQRSIEEQATETAEGILELEQQLAERGRVVLELQQRLREAQRAGRELILQVADLREQIPEEDLRGWEPPEEAIPPPVDTLLEQAGEWADAEASPGPGRRTRNDLEELSRVLATRDAELSADLEAARWVVAKLREELGRARAAERRPRVDQELNQAYASLQMQAVELENLAHTLSPDHDVR